MFCCRRPCHHILSVGLSNNFSCSYYIAHIQKNNAQSRSVPNSNDSNVSNKNRSKTAVDIFNYVDPPIAGTGSYAEEKRRYDLFMASQGVICQNIRHFGGKYMKDKNPPEFDPDGSWYLCLDPEVSLRPGSCIVYSVG